MVVARTRKARTRKAPAPTETQIHRQIADYEHKFGFGKGVVPIHVRNEQASAAARIKGANMGVLGGMTDWHVLAYGTPIYLEIKPLGWKARKARTGNYTEHERRQLAVHERLRLAGGYVEIVETLDEFLAVLSRHHVPIKKVSDESPSTQAIRRGALKALAAASNEGAE
jgi:hypothetical protein